MNYKQRIAALKSFKAAVSAGNIEDNASGFSTDVNGWIGGTAKDSYKSYLTKVKADTTSIKGKRASFLAKVDQQIGKIQAKFDEEYNLNSWYFKMTHEADPLKDKQHKQKQLRMLSVDESVRSKLKSDFGL